MAVWGFGVAALRLDTAESFLGQLDKLLVLHGASALQRVARDCT